MSLLNNFQIGADPEFIILDAGHMKAFRGHVDRYNPWGTDHGGWVIEPHPKPELSVKELVKNLRTSMNDFALVAPAGKWRAGAYFAAPERQITMGGHVHIDKPSYSSTELKALDILAEYYEKLDLLPSAECVSRRDLYPGYGKFSDVRAEHGHFEYRTLPSWLYSQRITKLCLVGAKLGMVDPTGLLETLGAPSKASLTKVKSFFERYKGKDDDVDWILNGGILDKTLTIKTDRDLRDVWSVKPEKENPHWKANVAPRIPNVQQIDRTVENNAHLLGLVTPLGKIFQTSGTRRTTAEELIFLDVQVHRAGAVTALAERNYQFMGMRGEPWLLATNFFTLRVTRGGRRYMFRIPEGHSIVLGFLDAARERLRALIDSGTLGVGQGLQVFEGLIYELRSMYDVDNF